MPSILILGLTSQVGDALDTTALPASTIALSRQADPGPRPGIAWARSDLASYRACGPFDAILSLGPLDALASALSEGRLRARHVVALSSTSRWTKTGSPDARERAVAARLTDAERAVDSIQTRAGGIATLLRPTLVWGAGRDATVSRVAAWARRRTLLALPVGAPGRRQPVHVGDLAGVVLRALALGQDASGAYDLPGGETLAFGLMLRRSVAAAAPACRLLPLPWRPLAALGRGLGSGALARLGEDLVFDATPARETLGWAPRGFTPAAYDLLRPEAPPP